MKAIGTCPKCNRWLTEDEPFCPKHGVGPTPASAPTPSPAPTSTPPSSTTSPAASKKATPAQLAAAIVFLTFVGGCIAMCLRPPSPPAPRTLSTQKPGSGSLSAARAFDVPSLVAVTSIDDVHAILGPPIREFVAPEFGGGELPIPSSGEWNETFQCGPRCLIVSYDIANRRLYDFFLTSDEPSEMSSEGKLLAMGNLDRNDQRYSLFFVRDITNPGQFTGVKVTPRDTYVSVGEDCMLWDRQKGTVDLSSSKEGLDLAEKFLVARDFPRYHQFFDDGLGFQADKGTRARVVDSGLFRSQVYVTSGPYADLYGWCRSDCLLHATRGQNNSRSGP